MAVRQKTSSCYSLHQILSSRRNACCLWYAPHTTPQPPPRSPSEKKWTTLTSTVPPFSTSVAVPAPRRNADKIQDYFIISSEKLKRGWITISRYIVTHIVYFKTQRTVIEIQKLLNKRQAARRYTISRMSIEYLKTKWAVLTSTVPPF